jgi:hypothetical protein
MSKTIINLATSIVIKEAEIILDTYPDHPYQQAFSIPELRQKLVSYVLCRVPGLYTVVDESEECIINSSASCCSEEQRRHITTLIHQGIRYIFQENSTWIDRHIPEETNPSFAPSSWFG